MLRFLRLLVTGCLLGCAPLPPAIDPAATSPSKQLNLVTSDWRPYTGDASDARVALDLVEKALSGAGYDPQFEVFPVFKDAEAKLHTAQTDGSPALWKSEEREAFLSYSLPYLHNRLVLVGRTDADVSAKSLIELAGKKVGVVSHYAYGSAVTEATETTFVQHDSSVDNLRALLDEKVDYVLVDELLIRNLMDHQPDEVARHVVVGKEVMVHRTLHLAIRKDHPDVSAIIKAFDERIRAMIADGSYHTALSLRWIRADVDGDGTEELVLGKGLSAGEEPPEWAYRAYGPTEAGAPPEGEDQKRVEFLVEGQTYEQWKDIPQEYRVPTDPHGEDVSGAGTLLRFKF